MKSSLNNDCIHMPVAFGRQEFPCFLKRLLVCDSVERNCIYRHLSEKLFDALNVEQCFDCGLLERVISSLENNSSFEDIITILTIANRSIRSRRSVAMMRCNLSFLARLTDIFGDSFQPIELRVMAAELMSHFVGSMARFFNIADSPSLQISVLNHSHGDKLIHNLATQLVLQCSDSSLFIALSRYLITVFPPIPVPIDSLLIMHAKFSTLPEFWSFLTVLVVASSDRREFLPFANKSYPFLLLLLREDPELRAQLI